MNYIFISPNYPCGHWRYVAALRQAGHNVYGIGDAGSETFPAELRGNLCDYYRVGDLHNYEEVYKACCYFISRYGRFDAVDSLNPYWCDLVAAVRGDFITCRRSPEEEYAKMREKYMYEDDEQRIYNAGNSDIAADAVNMLGGYPVLLLPARDKRLGVRRVENEEDLRVIIDSTSDSDWHIRRCAEGEPLSVDCLCDCRTGDLPFPTVEMYPVVWGIHVFGGGGCVWSLPITDNSLAQLNKNVLPSFFPDRNGLVFFHADCVRLTKSVKGLGKKGDIILNEWWQTPPHEMVIDCMNIEYDCDLRGMWAMNEAPETPPEQLCASGIASRSFERSYKNSHEKILRRLGGKLKAHNRTGGFDTGTFLDYYYVFSGGDTAEIKRGIKFITEDHSPEPRVSDSAAMTGSAGDAPAGGSSDERVSAEAPKNAPEDGQDSYSAEFSEYLDELYSAIEKQLAENDVPKEYEALFDGCGQSADNLDEAPEIRPAEAAEDPVKTDISAAADTAKRPSPMKKRTKKEENADT